MTVVALDFPGELSLICGLMAAYGLDISSGDAFTYEQEDRFPAGSRELDRRRKIVDVFTVRPVDPQAVGLDLWARYRSDLAAYLSKLHSGQRSEVRGELAKRVATSLIASGQGPETGSDHRLYPIEIQIDNDSSDEYTVLRIQSNDTIGFLYELTNALALNRIYIARVTVDTAGNRVEDILFVQDEYGRKITDLRKQRELRTATVLIKHFTHLLALSPDPESALLHFGEFLADLFKRSNWPDELTSLERPEVLDALARLLGVSNFLWGDFLRMQHANLFPVVRDVVLLQTAKIPEQLQTELEDVLRSRTPLQVPSAHAPWIAALNAFKDREMFRIDMRHILGHTDEFWEFWRN